MNWVRIAQDVAVKRLCSGLLSPRKETEGVTENFNMDFF